VELYNKLLQIELEKITKFYRVVIATILLCGCEDWAISRVDGHIYGTNKGMLRRAAGHTL